MKLSYSKISFWIVLSIILAISCNLPSLASSGTAQPTSRTLQPSALTVNAPTSIVTVSGGAENTLRAYLDALIQKDFQKAASLISNYSLQLLDRERDDIRISLEKDDLNGWKLLEYRIVEKQTFPSQREVFRVLGKTQTGSKDPQSTDTWVVMMQENNQWRFNWNAVIDDYSPNLSSQISNEVSVQPVQMIRYATGIRLILKVDNQNQKRVFWGWAGEKIATFKFATGDKDVSGAIQFEPKRVYKDAYIDVESVLGIYPKSVELKSWRLASPNSSALPDPNPNSPVWSYSFEFK